MKALQTRLGHEFSDEKLLHRAMCHRSWVAESDDDHSNERLEFLGDAVLGWVIADLVFHRFGDLAEGALTDLRKSVVNARALAEVAAELHVGEHILLGRGEDAAGGREKVSILSDAMEAVLGAVYLDGGADPAYALIDRLFTPRLADAVDSLDRLDYKSALQEALAHQGRPSPDYKVRSSGPDHDKTFYARVLVAKELLGEGEGRSKKAAEQAAASIAFNAITAD
ncbi:MAG: ribonuclease III [Ilumatobacter sp.]|uniref:ribonuclease III n=1 Tax=Ilumatobacter sp. TaxID=1967498 RepID=UPI0026204613|nr:ribonuclease III [Ilumatobacter sp.]MDJ0768270.1 ribonuclease III [Ilumatobacter sp.]